MSILIVPILIKHLLAYFVFVAVPMRRVRRGGFLSLELGTLLHTLNRQSILEGGLHQILLLLGSQYIVQIPLLMRVASVAYDRFPIGSLIIP